MMKQAIVYLREIKAGMLVEDENGYIDIEVALPAYSSYIPSINPLYFSAI